jgi:hypothetical protein
MIIMEIKLFEMLKEAYETTSQKFNSFKEAIEKIQWDNTFVADGEIYFVKDGFTLTVENTNPFEEQWKPTAYFSDNAVIMF